MFPSYLGGENTKKLVKLTACPSSPPFTLPLFNYQSVKLVPSDGIEPSLTRSKHALLPLQQEGIKLVVPKGVEPSLHSLKTSCPMPLDDSTVLKMARFLRVELSFPRLQRRPMTPQIQTG